MSKILNDSELQEIRGRAEVATPAPWVVEEYNSILDMYEIGCADDDICRVEINGTGEPEQDANNAVFVAHAPTDIHALLDHIDALAASLDAEAAAHSVTRAALVASPEWVQKSPLSIHGICPVCHGIDVHAPDCLRKVALEQAP